MIKISDYIFDYLLSKNVDTIFSVSGGAAAHLLNSVREKPFTYICNYHEQACAMAAEGYARVANKPACVLVTNGPGSSNTITGVLGAYQDSIPMIVISGQVPVNQSLCSLDDVKLRQLGVQECDIISMVKPITKYAVQITDPNTLQFHLDKAYNIAMSGRKGPVWLDIPLDIQNSRIEIKKIFAQPQSSTTGYDLDQIINLIFKAKSPVIVTGNGIHLSETEELFVELKNTLQIPVISTWTSKDLMSQHDPLFVGNFGLLGERAANFAVQKADLLLILGSRMSIPNIGYKSDLFSPNSIKIMVDIDENEIKKPTIKIDHPIVEDLKSFFPRLLLELKNKNIPKWNCWVNKTQSWKKKYPVFQSEYKTNTKNINSFYFMEILSSVLTDNNIIVTDMGTSYTCTMQSLQMNGKNRLFTSSACCSMGFGLPGAIGAYYANPQREVILISGDGGLQMNIQELQTVIHNKIPLKIFVLNNNSYLAITLMQDNLFNSNYIGSNSKSGISSPNFTKLAEAYGFKTFKLKNNKELEDNISLILNKAEPVLCEIMMTENQLLIPRVQSSKDADGRIISNSLENMFPYLDESEMKEIMK
jgi:acetolactate synthase-1/2/3 large subunit